MIETRDITKMAKHILRRDKGLSDPQIMHPMREWTTGLFIAVLIVFSGSLFSIYLYQSFNEKLQQEILTPEAHVPYGAETVKNALKIYNEEATSYSNILGQTIVQTVDVPAENTATSSLPAEDSTIPATSTESSVPEVKVDTVPGRETATPAL